MQEEQPTVVLPMGKFVGTATNEPPKADDNTEENE